MIIKCEDTALLTDMWLRVSLVAHGFISASYWEANYKAMRDTYLPSAENYVSVDHNGVPQGFISISGCHIEALFVDIPFQRKGTGRKLIGMAKERTGCKNLTVTVYEENKKAVGFYIANGFVPMGKGCDAVTGHAELHMEWVRNK